MAPSPSRRILFALATSAGFERAVRRVPGGSRAAWRRLAAPYVAGETTEDALTRARELARLNLSASLDLFGERVTDPAQADAVAEAYRRLAERLADDAPPGTWLSVDLSHLGVTADARAARRRLASIAERLPDGARLQVGAEEAALTDAVLEAVHSVPEPRRLTATVQANLRRSPEDVPRLVAAGIGVRLVKGAYLEDPHAALPHGDATDLAYLRLAEQLGELNADVGLATHHGLLREACRRVLPRAPVEMLLGVRGEEASGLADAGVPVRLYVPFGPEWFRYGMRRLAEARGA
ncbi:MAG TPA: proline dehydrogenase family protein [Solirubrobacteraceae bacterium]|nr:proline dehydrogenase family protein [Solirubrobacteraceae bacterium]